MSLTQTLLSSDKDLFQEATQCQFLKSAGKGTLPKKILSQWLSQDRLYAENYVVFVEALLDRIGASAGKGTENDQSLLQRIQELLDGARDNIHKEINFFGDVAKRYDLEIDQPAVEVTQKYIDLFHSFQNDPSLSLQQGMLVLWATERCYLSAWQYARSQDIGQKVEEDQDGGALRKEFIPNWTSSEFEQFVEQCAGLLDEFAGQEQTIHKELEDMWQRVLVIERDFWPTL